MELKCAGNSPHPPVSTHILVMMVRGIFFKLEYPYAHFATKGVTINVLFPLVWEAIRQLENLGLKVIRTVADGATASRKLYRMHGKEGLVFKMHNPFDCPSENRCLFFYF